MWDLVSEYADCLFVCFIMTGLLCISKTQNETQEKPLEPQSVSRNFCLSVGLWLHLLCGDRLEARTEGRRDTRVHGVWGFNTEALVTTSQTHSKQPTAANTRVSPAPSTASERGTRARGFPKGVPDSHASDGSSDRRGAQGACAKPRSARCRACACVTPRAACGLGLPSALMDLAHARLLLCLPHLCMRVRTRPCVSVCLCACVHVRPHVCVSVSVRA